MPGSPDAEPYSHPVDDADNASESPPIAPGRGWWEGWTSGGSGGDAPNSAPEFGAGGRARPRAAALRRRLSRLPADAAAKAQTARRQWRKQVTGDHDGRIREYLLEEAGVVLSRHARRVSVIHERGIQLKEEVLDARVRRAREEWDAKVVSQPHMMRVLDRLSFTGGVMGIMVSEYVLLQLPHLFWALYSMIIPSLLVLRYFMYRAMKYQYFMIDFCYYVQILLCIQIVWPDETLFRLCFAFANGPLSWAIVVWRNSLVFHNFDKTTSVYIHAFPMLLTYCWRWHSDDERGFCVGRAWWRWGCGGDGYDVFNVLVVPVAAYAVWQALYLVFTEFVGPPSRDPTLVTSLRYLAASGEKSGTVKTVKAVMVSCGLMRRDEEFDAQALKTKCAIVVFQFLFTFATLLPTYVLFRSEVLHLVFMLWIMAQCVWNGAAYYFEVFASSYPHAKARRPSPSRRSSRSPTHQAPSAEQGASAARRRNGSQPASPADQGLRDQGAVRRRNGSQPASPADQGAVRRRNGSQPVSPCEPAFPGYQRPAESTTLAASPLVAGSQ